MMITKTIEQCPKVLPVGKKMRRIFDKLEELGIIFVRTEGNDLIDIRFVGEYTYDVSTDALVRYYEQEMNTPNVTQIVALDTKNKVIAGVTSTINGSIWFPVVGPLYETMYLQEVMLILAAYETKRSLMVSVPWDCTEQSKDILMALRFRSMCVPYQAQFLNKSFTEHSLNTMYIRRGMFDILINEAVNFVYKNSVEGSLDYIEDLL